MSDDKRATIWRYFTDEVWYFWDMTRYPPRMWHETANHRKSRMIRVAVLLIVVAVFAWVWSSDTATRS